MQDTAGFASSQWVLMYIRVARCNYLLLMLPSPEEHLTQVSDVPLEK